MRQAGIQHGVRGVERSGDLKGAKLSPGSIAKILSHTGACGMYCYIDGRTGLPIPASRTDPQNCKDPTVGTRQIKLPREVPLDGSENASVTINYILVRPLQLGRCCMPQARLSPCTRSIEIQFQCLACTQLCTEQSSHAA